MAYLRECLAVARAEGAVLSDQVPQEIADGFRAYPADVGTSILADREAGRPLEWDTRNGVVLRRGRAHGVPTPISQLVVPILAAAGDGPADPWRLAPFLLHHDRRRVVLPDRLTLRADHGQVGHPRAAGTGLVAPITPAGSRTVDECALAVPSQAAAGILSAGR
ncbi:ketopantoate reductase C-terminal domain-containing protein [Amycolatopsis sp. FDAARGOS 1241]|uniref:ketopantoate reductase C-terminal domain-containing protein n=1 Tax=Amycolatopsis sp. FDAARGOS 1241 TaxID=2778070 RepID=UPI00194F532E|nr:ketopantoate reductase C-terminal domain-containing protein [Amycolatopsis sp. FDAARGOS 1241]QRP49487.1 hypothetical protein I6J71_18040 [Amycolatopsis sp. FDAARGOS 1241]